MSGTGRRSFVNPLVAGFAAGVLIALVVGLMAVINLTYGAPWAPTHTVSAQVTDADGMAVGSDVRIAGRLVGQVVTVKAAGDRSNITFRVDASDWPLPADTTASVRLATLLGQKYIQLNPGHSSQPMADAAVIGLNATRPVVDFDQILNTFDKRTRDSLTSLLRTVAGAVQGREGTVQQLIPDLSDLSVHSQAGTGELATRNTEINAILTNLGIAADQLNASRNDLAGVLDNLNTVSAALASNEGRALTGFISKTDTLNITTNAALGGGSAAKLDNGLKQLGTFANELNKLVATLIPQSQSFSEPLPACRQGLGRVASVCVEPSDYIDNNPMNCANPAVPCGSNAGIPLRSGIDLIYEITNATSQGYGSQVFGSSGAPNVQANFFLRQSAQGFELCLFEAPPLKPCTWGQTGSTAAAAQPGTSTSVAPTQLTPLSGPGVAPVVPQPRPSSAPSPTPSWSAVPSPSWSPLPRPQATPSTPTSSGAAQTTSYDIPLGYFGGDLGYQIWDVIFPSEYSG